MKEIADNTVLISFRWIFYFVKSWQLLIFTLLFKVQQLHKWCLEFTQHCSYSTRLTLHACDANYEITMFLLFSETLCLYFLHIHCIILSVIFLKLDMLEM